MYYIQLLFGLFLLIIGGNALVGSSVLLANRWRVSKLWIGLIVLGLGTSLPELSTSLVAQYRNVPGVAIGNVLGANIANILLVLGIAALIRPIKFHMASFQRDAIFLLLSTIVLAFALLRTEIDSTMGALMCMTLAFYLYYSYKTDRAQVEKNVEQANVALADRMDISTKTLLLILLSGIVIVLFGAHVVVEQTINIQTELHVLEIVTGLTIVALGTSLPELATAIVASKKGHSDMAVGNIVGANIYNALLILGVTALIMPDPVTVPVSRESDVIMMSLATLLFLFIGFARGKIGRKTGSAFICIYLLYMLYLGIHP